MYIVCRSVLMNSCLSFTPSSPLRQIQRSHWSSVGAKPHLGTLPSLKQIRPQRLIKPSMSKASWMRGYQRGEPFSATPHSSHNELAQDRALLFSADKKCQPLCCLHHLKTLFLAAKWCYNVVLFPF